MIEYGLPLIPYILSFFVSIIIAVYTLQNRHIRGATSFGLYALLQSQWILGYIFELSANTLPAKIFWDNFQYIGSFLVPVCVLIFALAYTTSLSMKILVRLSVVLSVVPIAGIVLAFTNEAHHLIGSNFQLIPTEPFDVLYYDLGTGLLLLALYSYIISFIGLGILINHTRKVTGIYRTQLWFITIGLVIPLISSFSIIFDITLNGQRDFQPITFGVGNIFVAIGLFRYRFFNIVPIAREKVLEAMNDAVIVLDTDQRIVDINPCAKSMFFANTTPIGTSIHDALAWISPHLTQSNMQAELHVINGDKKTYYELIARDIFADTNEKSGTLILIRDITEKTLALRAIEDARFQAELLADISDAMNNAKTEDDLLVAFSAILVQYRPTRIALMYVDYEASQVTDLRTVALQNEEGENLPLDAFPRLMNYTPDEFPVVYRLLNTDMPLYIENVYQHDWLGEAELKIIEQTPFLAMIIIPLRNQDHHEGFMVVSWNSYQTFPQSLRTMIELLSPRLAENITARRAFLQAEQAKKETEQFYRLSQSINSAITYKQILDAFGTVFGPFQFNTMLMLATDGGFHVAQRAKIVANLPAGEQQSIEMDLIVPLQRVEIFINTVLQIDNIADRKQVNEEDANLYESYGIRAILITDCALADIVLGRITFSSPTPYRFSAFEKRLIRGLSDLVAAALERARLYQEQVDIAEQLRTVDQMKSQFLANMSHELRTPLNAILNFTEFVSLGMLGEVNDKQKDALGKSLDSAKHLLALINDVLDMTKIEAGMMKLFIEENIDITPELHALIATGQTLLKDKDVVMIADIDPDLPRIVGDKRRIRQILLNLLSNACKFTEKGSVTLRVKKHQDELLFAVIDTGPGIPLADQTIIFEPFRQTEHGIKHAGGTGLGLPITQKLVEAHGGKLWLESDVGRGASFYLTLPIRSDMLIQEMRQSLI
ncbi:MAG: hypothetical protein CUN52_10700 [Phototrophicales bacterium]|nr:MAG: hypothetical protein CUN52_10700 [Phototrophicales bacterium]